MKRREHAMYGPLATYLQEKVGCSVVLQVGKGKQLLLRVPDPHKRIPDVVGARESHRGWETHVVEAKPAQGGAAAVPQALGQLAAIAPWSDFLYLALQHGDWAARVGPSQRHLESELARRGYGLLLVDGDDVERLVEPTRNKDAMAPSREELLRLLGLGAGPERLPFERLSLTSARAAATTYTATLEAIECVATEWKRAFKQKLRGHVTFHHWDVDKPLETLITTALSTADQSVYVEADPFGTAYAEDGEPRVWVWKRIISAEPLLVPALKAELRGWYLHATHGQEDSARLVPIVDVVGLKEWSRDGYTNDWHIGYPIALVGPEQDCHRAGGTCCAGRGATKVAGPLRRSGGVSRNWIRGPATGSPRGWTACRFLHPLGAGARGRGEVKPDVRACPAGILRAILRFNAPTRGRGSSRPKNVR